ncbi:hypothetical protein M5X00_01785 [Paenibacillus alvei]|uniref:Tetratricopeptide repeat protein n=1 Tax=Paenibacillus alvei TaxID=44250 RepID=A0ABT4GRV2_PAEAL|nr:MULTISPECIES: hypothetical protein [Paenibacillus]EJW18566.1 tetratricopeptide TPR_2 repeat-containing protein [Paenibacillus alvei DSM 29]MCY7485102.1 hypothetical protein [Paenibacillus alvei]MCY9539730.1 hypothetical protein [Paenibacillus alvei]MCY9703253.1 hypothetical protein [Paenibacillus alvei]MCY9735527.1 hypothetical protein [Paenibacillus alvei]
MPQVEHEELEQTAEKENQPDESGEQNVTAKELEERIRLQEAIHQVNELYQKQRYKEALEEAMRLQQQYPEHPTVMSLAAVVHKPIAPDQALHWASEALKRDTRLPDAWRVRMSIYYERREWPAFETAARQLALVAEEDPTPHLLLAQYQLRKGALDQALLSLERSIDIEPAGIAYATYSYVLAQMKRYPESREAERQALAWQEKHAYTLMQLAWAADQRDEHDRAMQFMQEAIRLNPEDSQVRNEYMDALQKSHPWFRLVWWPAQMLQKLSPWILVILWALFALIEPTLLIAFIVLHVSTYWISRGFVNWKVYGRLWVS